MRKIYNRATCFRAFRNWATCQKRLKSIELDKECHKRKNMSEGKTNGAVIHKPTLWVNFAVCNFRLAFTPNK